MTSDTSIPDPAPAPERPQAHPTPEVLAALQADLAAGRLSTTAFLNRVAELQAACIGASSLG